MENDNPKLLFIRHVKTFAYGATAGAVIMGVSLMAWHNKIVADKDADYNQCRDLAYNYSHRSRIFNKLLIDNHIKPPVVIAEKMPADSTLKEIMEP